VSVSAIEEDVVFDHAGAADLAGRFRAVAIELDRQSGGTRARPALAARAEWRGPHAEQFDQRVQQCCADGEELARAFRRAADGLDEMATAARREQRWREQARAWEERHHKHGFGAVLDNVHDFVFGEDDIPPPPPPAPQPRFLATTCGPRNRAC
jgi:uncharacterized protein YukE